MSLFLRRKPRIERNCDRTFLNLDGIPFPIPETEQDKQAFLEALSPEQLRDCIDACLDEIEHGTELQSGIHEKPSPPR